ACSLQGCISKHTYAPNKCEDHIRKLYLCCQSMYEATEEKGRSTACPMPSAVRRWLKAHPEE
ncbi:hypothetical protein HETIRDRAFT_330691, partial [Heterobasidion irregulare TC 32-1]